jgi:hypothetical protein
MDGTTKDPAKPAQPIDKTGKKKKDTKSKSNLSRLERIGILTAIATGIAGVIISTISMEQTQSAQSDTQSQAQAAQAELILAGLYSPNGKESTDQVMVQNFSSLPVYEVSFYDYYGVAIIGAIPPCSEVNVTDDYPSSQIDDFWAEGIPSIGLEYTDAEGISWYRVGAEKPHMGQLPSSIIKSLTAPDYQGGGVGESKPSISINSCH